MLKYKIPQIVTLTRKTTEWDIFKFLNLHFFVGDRNKKIPRNC